MPKPITILLASALAIICFCATASAGINTLSVRGTRVLLNGQTFKFKGLRCSNALISDKTTTDLINSLDRFKRSGINSVAVYMMGSRFGDVKGYNPNSSLSTAHRKRLNRILKATDRKGMVVIVGCLYWGTSTAKADLSNWKEGDAAKAVRNTARFLKNNNYRHVILDPDNEGQAIRANSWNIGNLIRAAKNEWPRLLVANNTRRKAGNGPADVGIHFGRIAGKPYIDTEMSSGNVPVGGSYWARFSKQTYESNNRYYNYSRIGWYSNEMKRYTRNMTTKLIREDSGVMLGGTWLQCGPRQGVNGPFVSFGGTSNLGPNSSGVWNRNIDTLHNRAGIRWWTNFIKNQYGPYVPPAP